MYSIIKHIYSAIDHRQHDKLRGKVRILNIYIHIYICLYMEHMETSAMVLMAYDDKTQRDVGTSPLRSVCHFMSIGVLYGKAHLHHVCAQTQMASLYVAAIVGSHWMPVNQTAQTDMCVHWLVIHCAPIKRPAACSRYLSSVSRCVLE